jgi:hypothetical protein
LLSSPPHFAVCLSHDLAMFHLMLRPPCPPPPFPGWFHEVTSYSEPGCPTHMALNWWFHPPDNLGGGGAAAAAKPYRWVVQWGDCRQTADGCGQGVHRLPDQLTDRAFWGLAGVAGLCSVFR